MPEKRKNNPTLITQPTIRKALSDHRARKTQDITDSKADGLQLRVRPSACRWSVRGTLHGRQKRYDLGAVTEGEDALAETRQRAGRVRVMLRAGMNPDRQAYAYSSPYSNE